MLQLRPAFPADNEALIHLTRACPMEGRIALRIDRNPDFFALARLRGPGEVFLVESPGGLAGCISLSMQELLWQGQTVRALYIADLKVHPDYRRGRTTYLLMRSALDFARTQGADLAYLLTPDGNAPLLNLLTGRHVFPAFSRWRTMSVYEFRPRKNKTKARAVDITAAEAHPLWSSFQERYELGWVMARDEFIRRAEQSGTRFRAVETGGRLCALAGLCDTGPFKQNVVLDMPPVLRLGVGLQRFAAGITGAARLPARGEAIRMLNLRQWAWMDGAETEFMDLFRSCLHDTLRSGHSFLSMGLDPADPLEPLLRKFPRFTFPSFLMGVCLPYGGRTLEKVPGHHPFSIDFSLV